MHMQDSVFCGKNEDSEGSGLIHCSNIEQDNTLATSVTETNQCGEMVRKSCSCGIIAGDVGFAGTTVDLQKIVTEKAYG